MTKDQMKKWVKNGWAIWLEEDLSIQVSGLNEHPIKVRMRPDLDGIKKSVDTPKEIG